MPRRMVQVVTLLGALLLGVMFLDAVPASAQDLVVEGCNILVPGELGIRELTGDVDEIVPVHVYLHTNSIVDAIQFEVEFPVNLLTFVSAQPGDLTGTPWLFDGVVPPGLDRVRILAGTTSDEDEIPAGTAGTIATIHFRVLAAGTGLFGLPADRFGDDIISYSECDSVNTSAVESSPWGTIKSRYR